MCDIVVKKFTFAISSPDERLYFKAKTHSEFLQFPGDLSSGKICGFGQFLVILVTSKHLGTIYKYMHNSVLRVYNIRNAERRHTDS